MDKTNGKPDWSGDTKVKMLRGYQADETRKIKKGEVIGLRADLAAKLVKAKIASTDAAIASE